MFEILDRAIKPVASYLQREHMENLGIRRTMGLAKTYNTWKHGRLSRHRRKLYRDQFDALLRDNGLVGEPASTFADGWALDTSGTLPHLQELLDQADEVICERGGKQRKTRDPYRVFFQNILADNDLTRYPAFLDFALSSQVLAPICDYIRSIPVLSGGSPEGLRFVESSAAFDELAEGPPRDSQLFHIDYYAKPMVYVIVLLKDVTEECGPFCWLGRARSKETARALNYWRRGSPYRVSDDDLYRLVDRDEVRRLCYPKGTVLFIDSTRCFHYGSRNAVQPRYQMMYAYSPACRTDFSEILRRASAYPVAAGDSRLRKLVLDKRYRA